MIWPYKGEALVSHGNVLLSRKISLPFNDYVMKTLLSDAESLEEHEETKYSPIGLTMAELWTLLCPDVRRRNHGKE